MDMETVIKKHIEELRDIPLQGVEKEKILDLMRLYNVETLYGLILAQQDHIKRVCW